ncbi:MAG: hypothetical protein HKN55_02945 [Woeseiaceae bacterium]|nr:hypothetical protein [Woeseiaceae bacterium]
MKPNTRSISGAVVMLAAIPAIIGILACLPVPIGDPERSRIDPEISGVWAWLGDGTPAFYAFEPYDKRTWLQTGIPLEEGEEADFSGYDLGDFDDVVRLMENEPVGDDGATASETVMYKTWRTKLGGEWFLTWEPKGVFGEKDFRPEMWMVFRMEKPNADTMDLYFIGDELFEGVAETRRAYERVIKKNAKNPELYGEDPLRFHRVRPEHLEFFAELAKEIIEVGDL